MRFITSAVLKSQVSLGRVSKDIEDLGEKVERGVGEVHTRLCKPLSSQQGLDPKKCRHGHYALCIFSGGTGSIQCHPLRCCFISENK